MEARNNDGNGREVVRKWRRRRVVVPVPYGRFVGFVVTAPVPRRNPVPRSEDGHVRGLTDVRSNMGFWTEVGYWSIYPRLPVHKGNTAKAVGYCTVTEVVDMKIAENRLKTFRFCWSSQNADATELADAGFICLNNQERIACCFCFKIYNTWTRGENPLDRHRLDSPKCQLVQEIAPRCMSSHVSDVFRGLWKAHPRTVFHRFVNMFGVSPFRSVRNTDYGTYGSRLRSFDALPPGTSMNQSTTLLAEAGFFLQTTKTSEYVSVCFCCNHTLTNWDTTDNVWMEHAKFSARCRYMHLVMGRAYVEFVRGIDGAQQDQEIVTLDESYRLFTFTLHTSGLFCVFSSNITNAQTREFGTPQLIVTRAVHDHLSFRTMSEPLVRNPDHMPDSLLCRVCEERPIEVAYLPCGHVSTCVSCALLFHQCFTCQSMVTCFMRVKINYSLDFVTTSRPKFKVPAKPNLCKVCKINDMCNVFIPCRHILSCTECSLQLKECPLCDTKVLGIVHVYLN